MEDLKVCRRHSANIHGPRRRSLGLGPGESLHMVLRAEKLQAEPNMARCAGGALVAERVSAQQSPSGGDKAEDGAKP